MSQDVAAFQLRCVEAVNTGELSDEALEDLCTADLQLENPSTAVTDNRYEGPAGIREWTADFIGAFGSGARLEIEAILAEGENFVVTRQRWIGRGARSDAPLELRWVNVTWIRDGKICRIVGYANRREAFSAVGLQHDG